MLIVDAPRRSRPRTADATRRAMVARYHSSQLTQRAFCAQAGIPISTLQWWLVQARREAAPALPVTFTEVPRPGGAPSHHGVGPPWAIEIVTRTGVTVRLREPLAPGPLRLLLHRAGC
jgi:transposase-like protein